ncbi:hypothetical protein WFJ45_23020, partial [Salmonella enterica subsp. enterica serovar Minnesota]|uniref:hypothetical protein n=1 Tax=Salmonella enterica TaxID=28901 RepID=UPI003D287AC7
ASLRDEGTLSRLRENAWRGREEFTFDRHADDLVAFFRRVIASADARAASRTVIGAPACL